MNNPEYKKRGYLHDDFRFFHLQDVIDNRFDYHYHEFDKIIIFFSGNVSYHIEGKNYHLKPWDILLVNHHDIHKPIIHPGETYERIVIWVKEDFMKEYDTKDYRLRTCFELVGKRHSNLVRMDTDNKNQFRKLLTELEISLNMEDFASELLSKTLFIQLMIYLNRLLIHDLDLDSSPSVQSDQLVDRVLPYINEHLTEDLTIETIAKQFFVSPSYLMHKFKKKTGYSLHSYIQKKRLILSIDLMKHGVPITTACLQSGFTDYSTFSRAFHRMYHCSPSEFIKK